MGSRRASETVGDIGEFGLIGAIQGRRSLPRSVIRGIGDDAAVVASVGKRYELLTADMLVEHVHFTRKLGPERIGRKVMACSLSDIAAMGGQPMHALVSLGVPSDCPLSFARALYRGMNRLGRAYGVTIVGGDTVKCSSLVINLALTGQVKKKHLVTRAGASDGDVICVTGSLGNSLHSGHHYRFVPRLREAEWLVRHCKPSAMIDISDGLAADLGHILKASGVGAELHADRLPLRRGATVDAALGDGEDFELCLTLSSKNFARWTRLETKPFVLYPVGTIIGVAAGLVLVEATGSRRKIPYRGFTHF